MISKAQLDNWFSHHAPKQEDIAKFQAIRDAAHNLAEIILENTPSSADQTTAIRHVRDAVMTANCAIACQGE